MAQNSKLYHVLEQEFVGRQSGHYRRGHTLFYSMMSSTDGLPHSHVASRMVSALFSKRAQPHFVSALPHGLRGAV
ncbi:uncharacterized [Tachysurus ichikawai]